MEDKELLEQVYRLLVPTKIKYSIYRTPAQELRHQADMIEKREELVSQFRLFIDKNYGRD